MDVKQISVFLENKPGALNEFAKLLQKNDINMRALCLAEISEYGVLRLIVNDTYELSALLRSEGYIFNTTSVLAVEIEDKPGSLVSILSALENVGINVSFPAITVKADLTLTVSSRYVTIELGNYGSRDDDKPLSLFFIAKIPGLRIKQQPQPGCRGGE